MPPPSASIPAASTPAADARPPRPLRPPAAAGQARLPRRDHRHRRHARAGADRAARLRAHGRGRRRPGARAAAPRGGAPAAPLYTQADAARRCEQLRPRRGLRRGAGARPGPARELSRCRAHPGLGARAGARSARRGASGACCSPATSATPAARSCATRRRRRPRSCVMESTYGDRCHRSPAESVGELCRGDRRDRCARGGNVMIPSFALERTQEILYPPARRRGRRPAARAAAGVPRFADGDLGHRGVPTAPGMLRCRDRGAVRAAARTRFGFARACAWCATRPRSMALNRISGGAVIMAGSGMCTGGRVRHHLRAQPAAPGRQHRVRRLRRARHAGAPHHRRRRSVMSCSARSVPVRARVHTINGFSAHADQAELLAWHARVGGGERTILVHGEAGAWTRLAARCLPRCRW